MTFLTLSEYLKQAKKILMHEGYAYLVRDEDAVSHVAHRMMVADHTWNQGKSSRETWRYNQAKYAILRVVSKLHKERKVFSLDYGWEDEYKYNSLTLANDIPSPAPDNKYEQFHEVCQVADNTLTGRQRECFDMYYKDGLKMEAIAGKLGITRQAVSLHVIKATKELKCALKHV